MWWPAGGRTNLTPPQRFPKSSIPGLGSPKRKHSGAEVYAVYEACRVGFSLPRQLSALGINCYLVGPHTLE